MRAMLIAATLLVVSTATACTSNTASPMPQTAAPSAPAPTSTAQAAPATPKTTPSSAATTGPTLGATPAASAIPSATAPANVSVTDVSLTDGGAQIPAHLVAPLSGPPGSAAGIAWFHWLETGDPTSNRTEFLNEAAALANQGVVSVLVDGQFPWHDNPSSTDHDLAGVHNDAAMLKEAVELLRTNPEVDKSRIALVGHDFGAMYSSVVFGEDPSIAALVMMAPTARWADWFLPYWHHDDDPETYKATFKPLDPVTALKKADGRPVLLQFATEDQFVPSDTADEITKAAGSGAETKDYETGHPLNEDAQTDRDAWLTQILQLAPAASPAP